MLVRTEEHPVRAVPGHQPCYTGVAARSDGTIILSDLAGYLCLYDPKDKTVIHLKLTYAPYSSVSIGNHCVVASSPDDSTICVVDASSWDNHGLHITNIFKTDSQPRSIVALTNGHLAIAWRNPPAFGVLDISGKEPIQKSYFVGDKTGRKFKTFEYLAVDEEKGLVVQPCSEDQAVYCFDLDGSPVFMYKDKNLAAPRGVTLDKLGHIYVCDCSATGGIHKLSSTGELISIFTEGVPPFPTAICNDVAGEGFWLTQGSMPLYLVVYFKEQHNAECDSL